MKQIIRGLRGFTGAVLISTLLLSLSVSAAIPGNIDGSIHAGKTTILTMENANGAQPAVSGEAAEPIIVADSCWIYIGGIWIYVCNHDEAPVKTL